VWNGSHQPCAPRKGGVVILIQNFGCRVAATAPAIAAVGLSVTPASAELRLSSSYELQSRKTTAR
jgi:hypothetical protein